MLLDVTWLMKGEIWLCHPRRSGEAQGLRWRWWWWPCGCCRWRRRAWRCSRNIEGLPGFWTDLKRSKVKLKFVGHLEALAQVIGYC